MVAAGDRVPGMGPAMVATILLGLAGGLGLIVLFVAGWLFWFVRAVSDCDDDEG